MTDGNRGPSCGAESTDTWTKDPLPRRPGPAGDADEDTGTLKAGDDGRTGVLGALEATVGHVPRLSLPEETAGALDSTEPGGSDGPAAPAGLPGRLASARLQVFGEIARGGMGSVLRGRDADLGRDLAVKVLLADHHDRPEMVRRFVEEAQIGGQLQHPGIVPVYELGAFADRRPFFTMKLVRGRTLAELLHEREDPSVDLPRFLGIFAQVCQTMAYAHARGVIHRDLKPSNVMVGSFGEVQVMDWGLAKVLRGTGEPGGDSRPDDDDHNEEAPVATARSLEGADMSQAGAIMGTPAFMAPEQALGQGERVDERADVFALGSILCEILTGRPAFTGTSSIEIVRKAARGDTAEALARLEACGAEGELVALARDALAVDRDERPRDASAVADRMTAYLSGVQERLRLTELARARADARAEEERKRRLVTMGLAAAIVMLVGLGAVGAAVYVRQKQEQASRLSVALRDVELLRRQALDDPNGSPERWAAAAAAAQRAADLLGPLIDARSRREVEDLREEVRRRAGAARADAELLRRAQDLRLRRMEERDDTVADASYASAFRAAGLDLDALGPEAAGARIRSRPPRVALALATVLDDWAARRRSIRGKDEAAWKRLVAAAGAADPDATRDRLRELWSLPDPKAQRAALLELARQADPQKWPTTTVTRLAWILGMAGENPAAVDLLRRTDLAQPGDVWVNFHLGRLLADLRPPRMDEAIAHLSAARALQPETGHDLAILLLRLGRFGEAKAILEQLVRLRPDIVGQWFDLARLLQEHGDAAGAADAREKGTAAARKAVLERPDDAERRSDLGRFLAAQGKFDEAIAECREAVRLWPDAPGAHHILATVLARCGKYQEAAAECRETLRLRPDDAQARSDLSAALLALSKPAEAVAEAREAIRLRPAIDSGYFQLARALAAQGQRDEAIAAYRDAIRLWADFVDAYVNLGGLLLDAGKQDEALAAYRDALRIRPDHPDAHLGLARVMAAQKKREEAIVEFREALRIQPDSVDAHNELGLALADLGRREEAVAEYRAAIRLRPDYHWAHRNLALVLEQMGRREEAIAEYREALRIRPRYFEALVDLGVALTDARRPAEAVEPFREALRIRPDDGVAHFDFGVALQALGKIDEAVAEYRQAVRLQPDIAQAHCNLGGILMQQGRYREALDALRKGHELGSRQPGWPYPTAEWIRQAEQSVQLEDRLPAVIRGDDKPKNADEGITLGRILHGMKRHALAARLFADALAADPRLADNLRAGHRYNAACDAALAADGQGIDPVKDDGEKARWRKQALDCLRADLAAWTKGIESGNPDAKAAAGRMLDHWKRDSDLAAIRDESALKRLPEAEQKACRALWTDVDARLAAAMRP